MFKKYTLGDFIMELKDEFFKYVSKNYKDIAFTDRSDTLFPDVETGYSFVKIVYNNAYHSLDMRFQGMGDYEAVFGKYVYPVLMRYRDFSVWKMASARVIRVKVPCINVETGFIEEDCDEQLERVRTLMEILSQIDVAGMYTEQRALRKEMIKDEYAIMVETQEYVSEFNKEINDRMHERELVGTDPFGKKGLLYRLSSMQKGINAFIAAHADFITKNKDTTCVILLMKYKKETDNMIKEIL